MNATIEAPSIEDCIKTCNSLLRGERSAVETYNKAIEKFGADDRLSDLNRIRDEHKQTVRELEQNVLAMNGEPDTDSGAWGAFAKAVQTTANFFGKESALESLIKGEEHGKSEYEKALVDNSLTASCRDLYATKLLPRVDSHILTLKRLEELVD